MGQYLRRFWHPVAALVEFDEWPVRKLRILGEELALFRADDGTLGLLPERCPHRGASLACGMIDGGTLRCAYHGWAFDPSGRCVDTPAEPARSALRERVALRGYPVRASGGLVWAYLGPEPVPLLPRYEHVASDAWSRSVGYTLLPCHWLQVAENTLDPVHVEHLHMRYLNWVRRRSGETEVGVRKHARIAFDLFAYGIVKRRLWEGESEDAQEWTVGHPFLFPGITVAALNAEWVQYQFRVPVDETTTAIWWLDAKRPPAGDGGNATVPLWQNPWRDESGQFLRASFHGQDMMVWVTQGAQTDRAAEHLGSSDSGIALYRRTLLREIERVAAGEDPAGVVRDESQNTPYISLPMETHFGYTMEGVQMSAASAFPDREHSAAR
jgi:5,5'-dehydrodivanillate O-demethylase